MIRFIDRLPMLNMHELVTWLASPLHTLSRATARVLNKNQSCKDDQRDCFRYSPQGHTSREIPPTDFLRTLR